MKRKISYCINTWLCGDPINLNHESMHCADCGAKLLVGDRYRLIEILNSENSGTKIVYKGIDTYENKPVLLKIVDSPREQAKKFLRREFDFLLSFGDPFTSVNQGDLFDWIPDENNNFFSVLVLVLPWIEGQDSLNWINSNSPISESVCIKWIEEILVFLEIMSDLSVMHRDIKPENIIVTPENSIRLIDLGSARKIDESYLVMLEENINGSARTGTRVVSLGYSPPEQIRGQAVKQSDYYALGKTIIYWLTGKEPKFQYSDQIDWAKDAPQVSQSFIRFINYLTEKEVGSRPQNVEVIRRYLYKTYRLDFKSEKDLEVKKQRTFFRVFRSITSIILMLCLGSFSISQYFLSQSRKSINNEDYVRALDELNVARTFNRLSTEILVEKGYAYLWNGDKEKANLIFMQVLKKKPNDPGILYHLGILNEDSNITQAKEFYAEALKAQPISIEPEMRLAKIALDENELVQAENYLDSVSNKITKYPKKSQPSDSYFVNFYLGWLDYEKGDLEGSKQKLELAFSNSPENSPRLSVRPGDIFCLLAEINTILENKEAFPLWEECFSSEPQTSIGNKTKKHRLNEFIINSMK